MQLPAAGLAGCPRPSGWRARASASPYWKSNLPSVGARTHWTPRASTSTPGQRLLLMPDVYEELFASAGRNIHDYLDLRRMETNYRGLFFDDGLQFDMTTDLEVARRYRRGDRAGRERRPPALSRAGRPELPREPRKVRRAELPFGEGFLYPGQPGNAAGDARAQQAIQGRRAVFRRRPAQARVHLPEHVPRQFARGFARDSTRSSRTRSWPRASGTRWAASTRS